MSCVLHMTSLNATIMSCVQHWPWMLAIMSCVHTRPWIVSNNGHCEHVSLIASYNVLCSHWQWMLQYMSCSSLTGHWMLHKTSDCSARVVNATIMSCVQTGHECYNNVLFHTGLECYNNFLCSHVAMNATIMTCIHAGHECYNNVLCSHWPWMLQ